MLKHDLNNNYVIGAVATDWGLRGLQGATRATEGYGGLRDEVYGVRGVYERGYQLPSESSKCLLSKAFNSRLET